MNVPQNPINWVDSHCHLNHLAFAEDFNLFANLKAAGCAGVLIPGTVLSDALEISRLQKQHGIWLQFALGLHPYFITDHHVDDLIALEQQIVQYRPVAMGEVGLDFAMPQSTHALQMQYFHKQVQLAKQHALPLVLHCRKAHDELTSYLKRVGFAHGGVVHGFSGSLQQARAYIQLGFVVGLGGALTYDRAKAMHKLVAALDDNAYVLETDSPYMPPAFARDETNSPLNIPQIAQHIAHLRGQSLAHVYQHTTANFKRILQLP